jgi:hypothetical protein
MANGHYEPPKQSGFGQFFDSLLLLALVFGALFVPFWMGLVGAGKSPMEIADKTTWTGLGQNETQQAAWAALGFDSPDKAADMIAARFDYTFDPLWLALTALVVIGYFLIVISLSKSEYREVIAERFGRK